MTKWRENVLVVSYIFLCLYATANAENTSSTYDSGLKCNNTNGCSTDPDECQKICGCDGIYKFDESKGECVIDYEYLKERTRSNNLMHTEKIRESTERVFQGIIFCAIFFIICASVCFISVCVYCCRMHYSDQKLKNDVKALAVNLKVDYKKKESIKKKPRDQKEESCNVIVEDANVMCV